MKNKELASSTIRCAPKKFWSLPASQTRSPCISRKKPVSISEPFVALQLVHLRTATVGAPFRARCRWFTHAGRARKGAYVESVPRPSFVSYCSPGGVPVRIGVRPVRFRFHGAISSTRRIRRRPSRGTHPIMVGRDSYRLTAGRGPVHRLSLIHI